MSQINFVQLGLLGGAGIVITGILSLFGYHAYQQHQRHGEAPIKRSWLPILGFALEMGSRPIELFKQLRNEYGEIFGMITLGNRMFIITDPHSYHLVINASPKVLSVAEFFDEIERKFFNIVHTDVDINVFRAGYSKHLFVDSGLMNLTQRMQAYLHKIVGKCEPGRVPMQKFLTKLIFRASVAAMFNENVGGNEELFQVFDTYDKALPAAAAGIHLKYLSAPWKCMQILRNACVSNRDNVSDFINYRWKLLETWEREGIVTKEDSNGYQLAMLWASVGNTMPAVFWMMYYILSNKSIYGRVQAEIQRVCGGAAAGEYIPLQTLNQMTLVNACLTEALRLSSGSLIMRIVKEDCTLTLSSGKSYKFRKGDHVGLCPPLTHLDDDVFADSSRFNPDRWLPEGLSEDELMESSQGRIPLRKNGLELSSAIAYLPFGGGASLCPGRKFARNEVKTLVVYLMQVFELVLVGNKEPQFDGTRCGLGIFPPKEDILIDVKRRDI